MGIILSSKTVTPATIPCDGLATVTLSLTSAPDITSNPVDVMLVLDRSGSMSGAPIDALKVAANSFIDIIKNATNPTNTPPGEIGAPNRIGIVSFATDATLDSALTRDVGILTPIINGLMAGGNTNHREAFELATANYIPVLAPPNNKIMVMVTDGVTTVGGNADQAAADARAAGITIYTIGIGNNVDTTSLINWAGDASRVLLAPTLADLIKAFENLAANITKPGAINITVVDTVEDKFEIVGQPNFSNHPAGTVADATVDPTKKIVTWTLDKLGVTVTESATVSFQVKYLDCTSATLPVNKSITYTDQHVPPNQASFPPGTGATVTVDCEKHVTPDCCEAATTIPFDPCEISKEVTLPSSGAFDLKCEGRILSLAIKLKNICPNRRIALGVIATEIVNGKEESRGFKAITVPGQTPSRCTCNDITVGPIVFIFPEDLSGTPSLCDNRTFKVRVIAHYIDTGLTNFDICPNRI